MTTQPQTDAHSTQINAETERALRDFVRAAVSRLSEALKDQEPQWAADSQWERGTDGHFREYTKRTRKLWPSSNDEWLRSLPNYDTCVKHLKSDVVFGPHLDRMVGTNTERSHVEADHVLWSAINVMLNDQRTLAFTDKQFDRKRKDHTPLTFTDERFDHKWRELVEFFGAERIAFKMIAPLPHLVVPNFPLRLNNQLVLDRLTEDEVTRCCQVGVLRPQSPRFPLISAEVAVGIRKTMFLPKLIRTGDEPHELPEAAEEGRFGSRPLLREDLVVDEVLSALRLSKYTQVRTTGYASWTDSPWKTSYSRSPIRNVLRLALFERRTCNHWPLSPGLLAFRLPCEKVHSCSHIYRRTLCRLPHKNVLRATVMMRQQLTDSSTPAVFRTRSSPAYSRERYN